MSCTIVVVTFLLVTLLLAGTYFVRPAMKRNNDEHHYYPIACDLKYEHFTDVKGVQEGMRIHLSWETTAASVNTQLLHNAHH